MFILLEGNFIVDSFSAMFLLLLLCTSVSGVILKDPSILPCQHYDLFDQPSRIISDGSRPSTPDDFEIIAHHAVHQLTVRSNHLKKFMLGRLVSSKFSEDGKLWLSFYQVESQCKNDGKLSTSLVRCAFKESGRVEKCNVTMTMSGNRVAKLGKFSCRQAEFHDVIATPPLFMSTDHTDLVESARLLGFQAPTLDNFKCFSITHGKSYASEEERLRRFGQFQKNMKMAYFLQITEQGSGVYGPTKFSDLSVEEFRRYSTGLKPAKNLRSPLKPADKTLYESGPLPDEVDWRTKNAVTPVKDQKQCGSCWAFSTTGNIEAQWQIKKGQLIPLSEQELVDCDSLDQGCGGGLMTNAYKAIMQLGGLEGEDDYPYNGANGKCQFKQKKVRVYINDSVEISKNETEMAQWLVKNGPFSIGINANAMMLYFGGVSHPWKIVCNPRSIDHGVLIVGYGKQADKPYWIVKNSWGPGWGVNGYYLVYRGDGTCGLNTMCSSAIVS